MLASKELPAAMVVLYRMEPSPDKTQLLGKEVQYLARWNLTWHWVPNSMKNDVQFSSPSLRSVAAEMARHLEPFEFAHFAVITGTEGFDEESPWELFPIEEVLEEVGHLFEETPMFRMEFGTREFLVYPFTTYSPRHFRTGDGSVQTHLFYLIDPKLGSYPMHLIYWNADSCPLDRDELRWENLEAAFLCGNEIVVFQTFKGAAQLYSDSRSPADHHRESPMTLSEARQFIERVGMSLEREGDEFVDVWGHAVLSKLGQSLLASTDPLAEISPLDHPG